MEKILETLIYKLKETYNDRLSSVFLYGSSAVEEPTKKSDINLMVIIKDLKAEDLKKAHHFIKTFTKKSKSLPIFMDKDEWCNSSDVYSIEYSDIKERHKILFGENLISSLNIEKKYLRIQCESEVKNLLIRLRQNYLANPSSKAIKNLILLSLKTFIVIFRTLLRLSGVAVPTEHTDVIKLFSEKITSTSIDFDTDLFLKLLEFRGNNRAIKDKETEVLVQKLVDTTTSVLKYVDKLDI